MATEGVKFPGYVDVKNVSLISAVGEVINLDQIVDEINVYQNLDETFLSCDILIGDSTSLFDTLEGGLGFTGQELLVLRYTTRFPNDKQKDALHLFVLNTVPERGRVKEKQEVLLIEGISLEGYLNTQQKISRAYGRNGGNTVSGMIKSIADEFFLSKQITDVYKKVGELVKVRIDKGFTISPSKSKISYVAPNVELEELIEILCSEADNEFGYGDFVFYEDSDGFHFDNVKNLVELEEVDTFTYEPSNYREGGSGRDMADLKKIIDYDIIEQSDALENIALGLFGSKTINIDVLRKKKNEIIFDYNKTASKFSKLNNRKLIQGGSYGGPNSRIFMNTTRFGHDTDTVMSVERHLPKRYPEIEGICESYKLHLSNIILSVTIHGNSDLNVGNKVNLIFPKATTIGEKESTPLDKYLSGYYLITTLKHVIQGDTMTTVMEVAKDTETSAPTKSNFRG